MPHATVDNLRFYCEEAGEGESLVFLHGFTLDHRMWQPQVEFFSKRFHVLCPDARGHGKSDAPLTGYSRAHRVQDLAGLVDKLRIDRFHLVGLSMGGATAIGYALERPETLRSLTLVSSGAAGYGVSKKISRLDQIAKEQSVEAALEKWRAWSLAWYKDDRADLRDFLDKMMADFSGGTWRDPLRGQYPREDDLSRVHRIKLPTAIFAGKLDKVFAELAAKLHTKIAGSRLLLYPKTGHMLNLEQPDRFNHDLDSFLGETMQP